MVAYNDEDGGKESYVRRVACFYENEEGTRMAHVHRFTRSCDTLLADAADPQEIFQELFCENAPLTNFSSKVNAVYWPVPDYDEFVKMGGTEEAATAGPPLAEGQEGAFFFRLRHDETCSRFEFAKDFEKAMEENRKVLDYCAMCEDVLIKKRRSLQVVQAIEPTGETDESKGAHLFK